MSKIRKQMIKRFCAGLLSFLMFFTMMPASTLTVYAEGGKITLSFTVVDEENNPVQGASVAINATPVSGTPESVGGSTDDVGNYSAEWDADLFSGASYSYEITKDGYKKAEGAGTLSETDLNTVNATLEKEITQKTVTVNVTGQATVKLNDVEQNSITVNEQEEVKVEIIPKAGYGLKTVSKNTATDTAPAMGQPYITTVTVTEDVIFTAESVKYFTITTSKNDGGVITINQNQVDAALVYEGTEIAVAVTALEGYQISAVKIGNQDKTISNTDSFSEDIIVTGNLDISATFVQVYTVSINYSGNGTVITNPASSGGKVTVETGKDVTIEADPESNYRVSEVLINNVADDNALIGKNFSDTDKYVKILKVKQNYEVLITFALNTYTITTGVMDKGSYHVANSVVNHGATERVMITPEDGYTVAAASVNGVDVTASVQKDDTGIYLELADITEDKAVEVSFKKLAKGSGSDFSIDTSEVIRKDNMLYVLKTGSKITFTTEKTAIALLDTEGSLIAGDVSTNTIEVGESKSIGKVKVYYQAADELYPDWHEVDLGAKIVIDIEKPEVSLTSDAKPNANGYFNSDITFTVKAADVGEYSGLEKVEYWITKDGIDGTKNELVVGDNAISGTNTIWIKATEYNSQNVAINVYAVDKAGNETTFVENIKINNVAPVVSIDIDGTKAPNAYGPTYNGVRNLTITVEDREDTFDPAAVAAGLTFKRDNIDITVTEDEIAWQSNGSTHVGTYTFRNDGAYSQWSFTYTNKAGMKNNYFSSVPNDKDLYYFVIDRDVATDLKVSYITDAAGTITEDNIKYNFYKDSVTVRLEATDTPAGINHFVYSYTVQEGASEINVGAEEITIEAVQDGNTNRYYADFEITAPFRGVVSFEAHDKSGNVVGYTDANVIVVDNMAPQIAVQYEPDLNSAQNGKYFSTARKATITITEANLFEKDLDDGLLVITVGKCLNNESDFTYTNVKPGFVKSGDVYTATIDFIENADYIFDIKYADRSGNVYDSYVKDEFTIDTIKPEIVLEFDNNTCLYDNKFAANRTATIVITEHNFDVSKIVASVTKNGVPTDEFTGYLQNINNWTAEGDKRTAKIEFTENVNYTFAVSCKDFANNDNNTTAYKEGTLAPDSFVVDKEAASDLKITYSPNFAGTILGTLIFGFYKEPVTVTIEATDKTTGVDYFVYSYMVQDGASTTNVGKQNVRIAAIKDGDTDRYYATFEIPAQFRGSVSFDAYDKSGNRSGYADEYVAVVDNVAPGINVQYDPGKDSAVNGCYFKGNRKATITMTEANFFEQDLVDELLVITVGTRLNNESEFTYTNVKPQFVKSGDIYTATIEFTENADYTFDIMYTDRSGNVYDTYEMDKFTIDKIYPEISLDYRNLDVKNGSFYNADREAVITVVEHNFRASDVDFTISATDLLGNPITLSDYAAQLKDQANWNQEGDVWVAELPLSVEGNYEIGMKYSDLAGNPQTKVISDEFCLDKTNAENLKITYEPTFMGTLLENLSFGFYQSSVKVMIEAVDEYAGVDYFVYSYAVQESASETNIGQKEIRIPAINENNTNRYYASFEIPAQFRGHVSFVAYDKAGNMAEYADANVVVVDNVAPGVNVTYDTNYAKYDKYYNTDRAATITVTEANFFEQDLEDGLFVITIGKRLDNETTFTETNIKPKFEKHGDIYTAIIDFTENADYTFDIKYTDRSGNVYDSYVKDEFTIDKIEPAVEISYDNDICNNGNQFNANRTATIVVTEHNFIASDIIAKVTASGTEIADYADKLVNEDNWEHEGDVHTIKLEYTNEAHYEFEFECADMAGNRNADIDYGTSVAPQKFTIDKSAPTDLTINVNEVSVLGDSSSIAFDTFYRGAIAVMLNADCDISGLESLKYQKVPSVSEYNVNGVWNEYNAETGIVVVPSEKFIIYFRAEDRAGNVSIVNSTGIVVDNKAPSGETRAPEIDILPANPGAGGVHAGSVMVNLKVVDPKYIGEESSANGYYSGINKITYRIYTLDTNDVEMGTLLDVAANSTAGGVLDEDQLICSWSGAITVDCNKFNSNNVIVEVVATDNAGNTRTSVTARGQIAIDITPPTIGVSYNNNVADKDVYFKENRTASIVITERNFKPENVALSITKDGESFPVSCAWSESVGSGNKDDTKWFTSIPFTVDGDYTFAIEFTDLAGWKCGRENVNYDGSVAATAFTIDSTIPTVTVTYNNNNAINNNYYNVARTATVVITEHNLEPNGVDKDRVVISMTATDDGVKTDIPVISNWTTVGDRHTAVIQYENDALYSFDIDIKDKAGNDSADFAKHTFYIDTTAPSLTISGIENNSANNGEVIPVITYSDTNYDAETVQISLYGANRKDVALDGTYGEIHNGGTFTFNDFAQSKEIDDIYILKATLTDKAGNKTTEEITFSVNRFGSTYALSEVAAKLNGTYLREPVDIIITETNVDKLSNIVVTLFKNNETIVLTEGSDYEIDLTGGDGEWYYYTYTIWAKNFVDDAVYSITVESDDKAGNVAKNDQDTKNKAISFGIDDTLPIINIENLESNTTYALESMTVNMGVEDNLKLAKIIVELDGREIKSWTGEELETIVKNGGDFSIDIPGDSTAAHNLVVYAVDAAGNGEKVSDVNLPANVEKIDDFYVTTNLWVRYYTNTPLFFGSIIGVILVAGWILFAVNRKRKKQ